ncbi:imidazole glycerol phosphate synthase subunit HisH [Kribbella alba]|uniref:Imidazole glycerol phosphate synthase subunit HisH n=1 Tax=Kribbella alba TaxID=190197 RepID=A0ABN2FML1_9ACTN
MTKKVVLLDYGSGNIRSGERALQRVGADVTVTADFDEALNSDGLLVPGVGAFEACMTGLRGVRGDVLVDRRLAAGRPVLGICVGMQILFARGIEHGVETEGCEQWPGVVERLQPQQGEPVPHMGWNTVDVSSGSTLFDGIEKERFYFVHSYGVREWELTGTRESVTPAVTPAVTWSTYGGDRFVAAVENGPLAATQFHPEKSGDAGAELLANWVRSL